MRFMRLVLVFLLILTASSFSQSASSTKPGAGIQYRQHRQERRSVRGLLSVRVRELDQEFGDSGGPAGVAEFFGTQREQSGDRAANSGEGRGGRSGAQRHRSEDWRPVWVVHG